MADGGNGIALFDFEDETQLSHWATVDDVVMGGVSASSVTLEAGALVFSGNLSLEHGGGFCSARSTTSGWDLARYAGLAVRARGDGRRYLLTVRVDERFDGVMYQHPLLDGNEGWELLHVRFEDFVPTYHGRVLTDAGPLDPAHVASVGLLVADRQAGPFRLAVDSVHAYR